MKEFFGFGGYAREAEGYLSWQHLLFVTLLVTAAVLLAAVLGRRNRPLPLARRNRVLIVSAICIDALELFKIVLLCFRSGDPMNWLYNLPQWDAIFSKDKQKELFKEQKLSGTVVKGKKIGRNDPCPCGSGKKYKHCCGR